MPGNEGGRRIGRQEDGGFSIVELLVSTTILMLVVVGMTTILLNSLTTEALTKARLTAASLASDAVENARAIGIANLTVTPSNPKACTGTFTGSQGAAVYGTCWYTTTVNSIPYTVMPTVTAGSGQPDTVTVTVKWNAGVQVFVTTTQIGPL